MGNLKAINYSFNPNITYPAYLTRNRLLKGIIIYANQLSGRLMDFGCGTKPYKPLFDVSEYVGVDFNNPGHPHLNEEVDIFYDGKHIPVKDEYFDSIFSSEVFEHVFNLPEVLTELNRVLKGDGYILITCPFVICEHEVPNDYARYSSYSIRYLMEEHGFEILGQLKTGNSIEAIHQLLITYLHQNITPYLRNIPIVRSLFRLVAYTSINLTAILLAKIFPSGKELYLNNIIFAKKIRRL